MVIAVPLNSPLLSLRQSLFYPSTSTLGRRYPQAASRTVALFIWTHRYSRGVGRLTGSTLAEPAQRIGGVEGHFTVREEA